MGSAMSLATAGSSRPASSAEEDRRHVARLGGWHRGKGARWRKVAVTARTQRGGSRASGHRTNCRGDGALSVLPGTDFLGFWLTITFTFYGSSKGGSPPHADSALYHNPRTSESWQLEQRDVNALHLSADLQHEWRIWVLFHHGCGHDRTVNFD